MVRTFIAIELNGGTKAELSKLETALKEARADVKWVEPENIHVTLKFLGDVAEDKIGEIKGALDRIGSNYKSFKMNLGKIGGFPKIDYPRVIWVGVEQGCAQIEEIAKDIEGEFEKLGFEKEKRLFSAHLTIGRTRSPKGRKELAEKIKALELYSSALIDVNEIVLFKSTLTPKGSIYNALHRAKMKV